VGTWYKWGMNTGMGMQHIHRADFHMKNPELAHACGARPAGRWVRWTPSRAGAVRMLTQALRPAPVARHKSRTQCSPHAAHSPGPRCPAPPGGARCTLRVRAAAACRAMTPLGTTLQQHDPNKNLCAALGCLGPAARCGRASLQIQITTGPDPSPTCPPLLRSSRGRCDQRAVVGVEALCYVNRVRFLIGLFAPHGWYAARPGSLQNAGRATAPSPTQCQQGCDPDAQRPARNRVA
jgi:hypothetical protein